RLRGRPLTGPRRRRGVAVPAGPFNFTTGAIARAIGAQLVGRDDLPIGSLDPMDRAGPGSLTFIRSPAFAARWAASHAAAALVSRGVEVPGHDPASRA